jgi:hypothetical protein
VNIPFLSFIAFGIITICMILFMRQQHVTRS